MNLDLVIPTYNRSALLNLCLNSVLNANIPHGLNVRVYVVDNNSTDDTKYIVQQFLNQNSSLKSLFIYYLFVGRPGKSAALNDALNQTDGDLIGFIDDDEIVDQSWFKIAYREFTSTNDIGFIGGPYLANWEIAPPKWLPPAYDGAIGVSSSPDAQVGQRQQYAVGKTGMLMGGNSVIKRSVLQQVLPYPEAIGKIGNKIRSGSDEVIYHRMLALGVYGLFVPDLIIYHWVPSTRLTKRYYRRWAFGRGISQGSQLRVRGFTEAALLGVPRYRFKVATLSVFGMMLFRSKEARFEAQLAILDCVAILYGYHFYDN